MPRIHLSPPDVGPLEREYLLCALESGWVAPAGPALDGFERDVAALTGWPGAVALSSGTAALHLALLVSGVQPGDDVLVSSLTFAASANAVVHCGANPVFVDSERVELEHGPGVAGRGASAAARGAVVCRRPPSSSTSTASAPITTRSSGCVAITASRWWRTPPKRSEPRHGDRAAGTLGDIGVFSFNGNKVATTSGGGALVTPDVAVADRVRHLATQAREPAVHFEHVEVGFNYRLSNLLAAIGRAQLARLPGMIDRRLAIHDRYREQLGDVPGVALMPLASWGRWNGWLTCIVVDDEHTRDEVIARLAAADIESRPLWKPMHLQPVFRDRRAYTNGVSDDLFRRGLCLPSGSVLTDDQVDAIAALVRATVASR